MTLNRLSAYSIGRQLGEVTQGLSTVSRQVASVEGKLDRLGERQTEQAQTVGALCGRVEAIEKEHETQDETRKENQGRWIEKRWAMGLILLSAAVTQGLNLILSHWR